MAPANGVYQNCVQGMMDGSQYVDLDTNTIRCVLLKDSHTPNFDTHDFLNDIPAADRAKTGTGYNPAVTSPQVNASNTDDSVLFGDNITSVSWTNVTSGVACSGLAVFKSSGNTTQSPLICVCSFTASVTAGGDTVTATLNANGFFKASYQT